MIASRLKPSATSWSAYTPSSSGPRWLIRSRAPATQFWSGSASRARARQPAIPHIEVPNGIRESSGHRSYGGASGGGPMLAAPVVWEGSLLLLRRAPPPYANGSLTFPDRGALLREGHRALPGVGGEEHRPGDLGLPAERLGHRPVGGLHHDLFAGGQGEGRVPADLDGERARVGKGLTRRHQPADQPGGVQARRREVIPGQSDLHREVVGDAARQP